MEVFMGEKKRCSAKTEVFQRVTGFYRPVQQWNKGKRSEYEDRLPYDVDLALNKNLEDDDERRM